MAPLCKRELGLFPYLNPEINETLCYTFCPDMSIMRTTKEWFPSYKEFSFWINGVLNMWLITMGSMGILLVMLSIRKVRGKYRLMWHVRLLCLWDSLALFSMFGLSALPSLLFKTSQVYGTTSYFIRVFLPLSNIANLASMWQIIAIAAERYLAVTYPLRSHASRNSKSLQLICAFIAVGAVITYVPIVLESKSSQCYNVMEKTLYPMLANREFVQHETYQWIVHRIPSFLLRSPTPFAVLIYLTAGTLRGRSSGIPLSSSSCRRSVTNHPSSNATITLTIINIKFILLQSLPVAYDVMSIMKTLSLRNQFYMADINNLLHTLQSATNWLVFMQWNHESRPTPNGVNSNQVVFTTIEAETIKQMYKDNMKTNMQMNGLDTFRSRCASEIPVNSRRPTALNSLIQNSALESVVHSLTREPLGWLEARDQLRDLGVTMANRCCRIEPHSWADAKRTIVDALMGQEICNEQQRLLAAKFASFVIREVKHGMLCQRTERRNTMV